MIQHIFRMIWNQRKSNAWMLAELILASVCLWFVVDSFYGLADILHRPLGFDISHTYRIDIAERTPDSDGYILPENKGTTTGEDLLAITERIRLHPAIESVCLSKGSEPYTFTGYTEGLRFRKLYHNDTIGISAQEFRVTPSFFEVFRNKPDKEATRQLMQALRPGNIILSEDLKEKLAGGEDMLGKYIEMGKTKEERLIGALCTPVRWTEYFSSQGCYYLLLSEAEIVEEVTKDNLSGYELCVRVKPDADAGFAESFTQDMLSQLSVGNIYLMDVCSSEIARKAVVVPEQSGLVIGSMLFVFILLNIFLGISGTFMFRTQYRRLEMGLRIAVGSTRRSICSILIAEGLALLALATIPAIVVDLNIAWSGLLNENWIPLTVSRLVIGIATTYVVIAVMIMAGVWFPARKMMQIHPADALHEEG